MAGTGAFLQFLLCPLSPAFPSPRWIFFFARMRSQKVDHGPVQPVSSAPLDFKAPHGEDFFFSTMIGAL